MSGAGGAPSLAHPRKPHLYPGAEDLAGGARRETATVVPRNRDSLGFVSTAPWPQRKPLTLPVPDTDLASGDHMFPQTCFPAYTMS